MRDLWPTPDAAEIAKQLAEADRASFDDRVNRIRNLYSEFGPPTDMLLLGGIEAMYALQEMQNCYVTANSMAVVLLAQTFIEHSLAGGLILAGEDETAESGFARINRHARDTGRISPDLFDTFETLRKMRNPYVHPKVGLKEGSGMRRLLDSGHSDPRDLADADAEFAIMAVVDFIRHDSSDWRLGSIPENPA
jgi:hypothetical protein